ncbi:hypothetical protein PINS_up008516 [Pythium insidiosum]|nr:hypothetical protein PINS_up008516 [Pythium insidiosum]
MIRQHPWVAHSRAPPLPRALVLREDPSLRELILTQLEALGLDRDDVLAALTDDGGRTHNALTAAYYLLFKYEGLAMALFFCDDIEAEY